LLFQVVTPFSFDQTGHAFQTVY